MSGQVHVRCTSIPLSSLCPDLEAGWPLGTHWVADSTVDNASSLEHPAGSTVSFRLRRFSGSRLRARVSLASYLGDSPAGAARVQVLLRSGGVCRRLWAGVVGGAGRLPVQRSLSLDVELRTRSEQADLLLCASSLRPHSDPAARIRWQVPTLESPTSSLPGPVSGGAELSNGAKKRPSREKAPMISILTPVHNPPADLLEETLASVRSQTHRDWELCLVDDGSSDERVLGVLDRAAAADPRIQLLRHSEPGGISAATNSALGIASGEYVALLDHDDLLHPEALELVGARLGESPELDMVYTDEEMVDGDRRVALLRKPSWSPDLMRSHMYTCHLGVYRRDLAEEIGGFRSEFDGSQDYDFVLRLSERTDRIAHIPRVLYKWRAHEGSAADNVTAKPHAYSAAQRAIADHLRRTETGASVHFGPLRSWYRVESHADGLGPVALVLAAPEMTPQLRDHLGAIGESWLRGDLPSLELAVAAPEAAAEEWERALGKALAGRLRIVVTDPEMGKSERINRAVAATGARQLVLLAAPLEALTTNALSSLASFAARPGIGLVVPKVLTPEGRVQSIGAILRDGLPVPVQLGADQIEQGPLAVLQVSANYGAATGTVAITRDNFEQLGGMAGSFEELAAADLCLRAWQSGLRIVSTPDVVLRRLPGAPAPVNDVQELKSFRTRWLPDVPADPYYCGELATVLTGAILPAS
jgi:GT2 family glycosyltransferase